MAACRVAAACAACVAWAVHQCSCRIVGSSFFRLDCRWRRRAPPRLRASRHLCRPRRSLVSSTCGESTPRCARGAIEPTNRRYMSMGSPPHSSMVPRLQPAFAGRGGLTAHPLRYRGGASARRRASDQDLQRLASFVLAEHPGLLGPFQLQLIRAAPWHGAPLAEGARELRGRIHARGAGGQDAGRRGGGARERATHAHM